ncbi:MAG: hypothetical protein ABSH40_22575 [Bryobacteraceae bacterium]|jgi:hypothetical protein
MRSKFLMIAASIAAVASPQAPRLVREVNLNAIVHEAEGLLPSTQSVQVLAFSPDEKWVAVCAGLHRKPGMTAVTDLWTNLLVIPVAEDGRRPLQIDPGEPVPLSTLNWSPDSSVLILGGWGRRYAIEGAGVSVQGV